MVHGLIGPHPNNWTLYAFLYITIGCLTFFGSIFGCVQWLLDMPAWALWALPGGILLSALMYALSQAGQRLAEEQTRHLHRLVREALGCSLVGTEEGES